MEIKTAEEILEELEDPIWAMKEYAEQFIDLAAEEVKLGVLSNIRKIEARESILNLKQLIK